VALFRRLDPPPRSFITRMVLALIIRLGKGTRYGVLRPVRLQIPSIGLLLANVF